MYTTTHIATIQDSNPTFILAGDVANVYTKLVLSKNEKRHSLDSVFMTLKSLYELFFT